MCLPRPTALKRSSCRTLLRRVVQNLRGRQPVVEVAVGGWAGTGQVAGAIRREVFIEEQRIPARVRWDGPMLMPPATP